MHVKATPAIWNDIKDNITALYVAREARAADLHGYGVGRAEFDAIVRAAAYPADAQARLVELGPRYFRRANAITVRLRRSEADTVLCPTYELALPAETPVPGHWTGYLAETVDAIVPELADVIERRAQRLSAVRTEREQLVAQARSAFQSVTSVNQLLRAWPAVQELLPRAVLERVNRKTERVKKAIAIDGLQQMNATLLSAKVAA